MVFIGPSRIQTPLLQTIFLVESTNAPYLVWVVLFVQSTTSQEVEITHASSTLPKQSTKSELHDGSADKFATLPLDGTKVNKNSRIKAHVQFNETPTIMNPSLTPQNSDPSPPSTPFSPASFDSPKALKSLPPQSPVPKTPPPIMRPKIPPPAPPVVGPEEVNNDSLPPPINLNTLPPRSSLIENTSFDFLPLTPTEPAIRQVEPEKTISIIGDMIQRETSVPSTIIDDSSKLVSATYSTLPSPRSVPTPLEIYSNPIGNTAPPQMPMGHPTFYAPRPFTGQYYMMQPMGIGAPMLYNPDPGIQFVPYYPMPTTGMYPEKSPSPAMSYLSSASSTPVTETVPSISELPPSPKPLSVRPGLAGSTPDIRAPPPVPLKPKNRFSAYIPGPSSSVPGLVQSHSPIRGASPILGYINTHATSDQKQAGDVGNKVYGARILDLKNSRKEVGYCIVCIW